MKSIKQFMFLGTVCAGSVLLAGPSVSGVSMTQASDSRKVTVAYTLDAPAIVTVDFLTNGVSIGGANITRLKGDVNKKVEPGAHTIVWDPSLAWPGEKIDAAQVSAAVTAWALDNPPDYMVVELAEVSDNRVSYYPSVDFLPGGLLENESYRTSKIVMRRIPAAGVTWTMGEVGSSSVKTHTITSTEDYYMSVFEITQGQWFYVKGDAPAEGTGVTYAKNNVSYLQAREVAKAGDTNRTPYPQSPYADSFLGKLRKIVNQEIAFDLPSEIQFEFASRGGHGCGVWGNGTSETLGNLRKYARCDGVQSVGGQGNTGCFEPNDYGLYDMSGNVAEYCLDMYATDISGISDGSYVSTTGISTWDRAMRGGAYWQGVGECRPSYRVSVSHGAQSPSQGFRVAAPLCDKP